MTRQPTLGEGAIREQFHELADLLDRESTVYLIGGGALTLQELKNATKDIDLIVQKKTELDRLREALESAGYSLPDDLEEEYDQLEAAFILENGTRRFDVFHRQVAGVLVLSEEMTKRSQHLFDDGPLSVRIVSLNDIFLFKSVANRDDDVDDMIVLAQAGMDEDIIMDEVANQLAFVEKDHFIGAMKHKLDRLAERDFSFDIHGRVEQLYERTKDAEQVVQSIKSLRQTEYDDDLYMGVPEMRVKSQVGEEKAMSGIEWLEKTDRINREQDGSLVLTDESSRNQ